LVNGHICRDIAKIRISPANMINKLETIGISLAKHVNNMDLITKKYKLTSRNYDLLETWRLKQQTWGKSPATWFKHQEKG